MKPSLNRRGFLAGTAALLAATPLLSSCGTTAATAIPTGAPKRGGTLRVGITGGGSADTLDPHIPTSSPDIARNLNLYEPLLGRDRDYQLEMLVAKSVTASADARTWTAVLRDGIRFHDGRPVTPADVVATFRRITDPNDPKNGAASLGMLAEVVPVGDNTVEFRLTEPSVTFDDYLGQYPLGIVPADFDAKKPIGTGPFRAEHVHPGAAKRVRPQRALLAARRTVPRQPGPHRLPSRRRTHQRPAVVPGGRHRPGSPGTHRRPGQRPADAHPHLGDRHLAAVHHAGRPATVRRHPCARGDAAHRGPGTDDHPGAVAARAGSATTSTRRSTRPTPTSCRNADRTSRRHAGCSPRRARRT